MSCPFCGLNPYEYADVGIGGPGIPIAVNCCEFGPALFDARGDIELRGFAERVADELGDMPNGDGRYAKAAELFAKYRSKR